MCRDVLIILTTERVMSAVERAIADHTLKFVEHQEQEI